MRFLLDTDTCIDLLRGVSDVVRNASNVAPDDCAVSAVTVYELFTGVAKCRDPQCENEKVELLLARLHVLPFDAVAGKRTADVRAGLERTGIAIGPYDVMLAGQALSMGLALVTSNVGEFQRVTGLRIVDWRRNSGQG